MILLTCFIVFISLLETMALFDASQGLANSPLETQITYLQSIDLTCEVENV